MIPMNFIASITSEKQFAASMITNDSHLIFLDEWSEHTLQSDMAKTVLQGGFMTKAVKHQIATCVINNKQKHTSKVWVRGKKREPSH